MKDNMQKALHGGWIKGKGGREKTLPVGGQHKPDFKEGSTDLGFPCQKAHVAWSIISAHSEWIAY